MLNHVEWVRGTESEAENSSRRQYCLKFNPFRYNVVPSIVKVGMFLSCKIFIGGKQKQCGRCEGCNQKDCGKCKFCLDKPKFGGPGKKKKKCINRHCTGYTCTSFNAQPGSAKGKTERLRVKQPVSHIFKSTKDPASIIWGHIAIA